MSLIDFHCHLDLYQNFTSLLEQCEQEKIYTLAVTTTPRAWPRNHELTKNKVFVKAALGFHPQLVSETWKEELRLWEKYLPEAEYVGEVGIDGSKNYVKTLQIQKQVFETILKSCAVAENKVLSVHSLNASKSILDLIEEHLPQEKGRVVLHWFTGTISEAKRALRLGCYFSINPKMLMTKRGLALIDLLPIERMLSETDGPFVQVENRTITPTNAEIVIQGISKIKKISDESLRLRFVENLKNLKWISTD